MRMKKPSLDDLLDTSTFVRVPGLLRAWEIDQVVKEGAEYHIEAEDRTSDGTPLFAVYRRESHAPEST
jgi:hypothetical protein